MNIKFNIFFGKIDINNKTEESFENVLKRSKIIASKEQIKLLKEWISYKNKENIKCRLIYDAKMDGVDVAAFHSLCDYKSIFLLLYKLVIIKK